MSQVLSKAKEGFQKAMDHLKSEYSGLQIGRASSSLVENMSVDAYGMSQPMKAVASISVPDGKSLQIQPWDKGMLAGIEKAIRNSDLNLNPVNNGVGIILNIPPLTEDRRKDLVKVVNRLAEEAKIAVRNSRHDAMSALKRMEGDGDISEDERSRSEKQLQEAVDASNKDIVATAKAKEEMIMTV